MFFMMGITDGRKDFDFNQVITCDECGRYGRYQVYMTYMVLSLFFIDEVSKYRLYDGDNDDGRNGEYAKMFEEEYENVVGQMQRQFGDDAYLHYLDGIDVHKTHQGYFSIDKKKGKKARFVEGKIDRKTQLSDDVDA